MFMTLTPVLVKCELHPPQQHLDIFFKRKVKIKYLKIVCLCFVLKLHYFVSAQLCLPNLQLTYKILKFVLVCTFCPLRHSLTKFDNPGTTQL